MGILGWSLVAVIAAGKFACFAIAVRNALRPRALPGSNGGSSDDRPDWDFWERDLLDPGPPGEGIVPDRELPAERGPVTPAGAR